MRGVKDSDRRAHRGHRQGAVRGRRRTRAPPGDRPAASAIASRATARAAVRGGVLTGRWFQRSTRSEGAGESGLANLIDLHAIHSAGDALLTVALANTLFFSVDVHQARSRVAIYLLVTMAPFAVVAPIVGPLLDRVRRGRRYALMTTLILRAFLAWVIAGAVGSHGAFALYPAAFGALVCSKAYGVSRSAVVPRVLPPDVSLVRGNARLTLWGVLCATIAAPIGQGLSWATGSPSWTLRLAAIVYLAGSAFALRLPSRVDSSEGEVPVRPRDTGPIVGSRHRRRRRSYPVGPQVGRGSGAAARRDLPADPPAAARRRPTDGLDAAGERRTPRVLRVPDFVPGVPDPHPPTRRLQCQRRPRRHRRHRGTRQRAGHHDRGPVPCPPLGTARHRRAGVDRGWSASSPRSGSACSPRRLRCWWPRRANRSASSGSDSVIQRDVDEDVRTSAFARSETVLQLSWVLGGFLAIVLPSNGALGLGLGAAVLGGVLAITVRAIHAAKAAPRPQPRGSSPAWH